MVEEDKGEEITGVFPQLGIRQLLKKLNRIELTENVEDFPKYKEDVLLPYFTDIYNVKSLIHVFHFLFLRI